MSPSLPRGECLTLAGERLGVCSCPLQEPVDRNKERIQRRPHLALRRGSVNTGAIAILLSDTSYKSGVPCHPAGYTRLTRVMGIPRESR